MKEFYEKYKDRKNFDRNSLEEFKQMMNRNGFKSAFRRYDKSNKKNEFLKGLKEESFYREYLKQRNVIKIKAIIFHIVNEITNDDTLDMKYYNKFFVDALKYLIEEENSCKYYCAIKSVIWAKAVINEGSRIINLDKQMDGYQKIIYGNPEINYNLFSLINNLDNQNRDILSMEEHFFIISLGKSIDFLQALGSYKYDVKEILKEINDNIGIQKIINLRNMREHDDEYIKGNGNKQSEFIQESEDKLFVSDATSTIRIGDKHLLGGKIEVVSVVKLYKRLLPKINEASESVKKDIRKIRKYI